MSRIISESLVLALLEFETGSNVVGHKLLLNLSTFHGELVNETLELVNSVLLDGAISSWGTSSSNHSGSSESRSSVVSSDSSGSSDDSSVSSDGSSFVSSDGSSSVASATSDGVSSSQSSLSTLGSHSVDLSDGSDVAVSSSHNEVDVDDVEDLAKSGSTNTLAAGSSEGNRSLSHDSNLGEAASGSSELLLDLSDLSLGLLGLLLGSESQELLLESGRLTFKISGLDVVSVEDDGLLGTVSSDSSERSDASSS